MHVSSSLSMFLSYLLLSLALCVFACSPLAGSKQVQNFLPSILKHGTCQAWLMQVLESHCCLNMCEGACPCVSVMPCLYVL